MGKYCRERRRELLRLVAKIPYASAKLVSHYDPEGKTERSLAVTFAGMWRAGLIDMTNSHQPNRVGNIYTITAKGRELIS